MTSILSLLNKSEDAYEIDLSTARPPSPTPPSTKPQQVITPYRPTFLPPSKKAIKREGLKRNLVVPSELMKMKQGDAAIQLGIPASTFSKRWRESLPDRKWPFRTHRKLEKNMKTLINMHKRGQNVHKDMDKLQRLTEQNLAPATIQLYEDAKEGGELTFVSETPNHTSHSNHSSPSSSPEQSYHCSPTHSPSSPRSITPTNQLPPLSHAYPYLNPIRYTQHENSMRIM